MFWDDILVLFFSFELFSSQLKSTSGKESYKFMSPLRSTFFSWLIHLTMKQYIGNSLQL